MNPDEVKAALVILTILILGAGWLLALRVRLHFQVKGREAQRATERELGSSRSRDPQPNEIWRWPSRSHGVPGAWGGPTEVLENYLVHRFDSEDRPLCAVINYNGVNYIYP